MEIKNEALSILVKSFEELPDSRRKQGQRHDQSVVLMIVLFSTMSGYLGYRAMGDFVKKHKAELVELLKVKKTRLPSFSTIRRVLINLNTDRFEEVYRKWLKGLKSKLEVASQEVN